MPVVREPGGRDVRLASDFVDYYDHHFGLDGPILFSRSGAGPGPTKPEQFDLLAAAGYNTPPHGLVRDVAGTYWGDERRHVLDLVVYDDPTAHCGDGKRISRAGDEPPEKYCSAYLGDRGPGVSWRYLQVGRHHFWLEYTSEADWRSNVGDGAVTIIGVGLDAGYHPFFKLPLFAVDFVIGNDLYAVDFNTAPGIRGSGVEKILPPKAAAQAIKDACNFQTGSTDFCPVSF